MTTLQISTDGTSKQDTDAPVPTDDLQKAIDDTRQRRNLCGPFSTAQEAVSSMLGE